MPQETIDLLSEYETKLINYDIKTTCPTTFSWVNKTPIVERISETSGIIQAIQNPYAISDRYYCENCIFKNTIMCVCSACNIDRGVIGDTGLDVIFIDPENPHKKYKYKHK